MQIRHVIIKVDEQDKALSFYTSIVGFVKRLREEARPPHWSHSMADRKLAMAQSWSDPIKASTDGKGHPILGGFLEEEFQKMFFQCTSSRMHVEKTKLIG